MNEDTNELSIIDLIHTVLQRTDDPRLQGLSFECDNDSGEIIITWKNGEKLRDYVISTTGVIETERDGWQGR